MWGTNSKSQRCQSNNKLSFDANKSNNCMYNPTSNYNNNNDLNLVYQTPIKQFDNINNNNNSNTTPFRFDFNYYFGNLWSAGQIPNNQLMHQQINLSPNQLNKDNLPFFKKSLEKSYRITPISQMKDSNSHNNSICNSNKNIVILNTNIDNSNNNKINELFDINNCSNVSNINELSKKNLNELFNNAKNDTFLYDENKRKTDNNNGYNLYNNKNNSNNLNNNTNNIRFGCRNGIKNRNYNLQISRQFIFSSPCNISKPKKIFECSGSTLATNSSNRTINKNRRFRKNNEQIALLKKFYQEHKHWSKKQIKEISQKIGLKENKVYKWLWDQRNKEMKATKFVVKKQNNE